MGYLGEYSRVFASSEKLLYNDMNYFSRIFISTPSYMGFLEESRLKLFMAIL